MDIQLKNINIEKALSQETTAFTADLYINGTKAGQCSNYGAGGMTIYQPIDPQHRALITQTEAFCKALPPMRTNFPDPNDETKMFVIKMDLSNYIDHLVYEFQNDKEKQKFHRQMERDMKKSILIGNDDGYETYNFNQPLEDIIKYAANPVQSITNGLKNVVKHIKPGQRILNTNLPKGVIIPEPINA